MAKLSYLDYYKLKSMIEKQGTEPTNEIKRYDNEKLTYKESYELTSKEIKETTENLENLLDYLDKMSDVYSGVINVLVYTLESKGILNQDDIQTLLKEIKKKDNQ